jgi:hypothetical protein
MMHFTEKALRLIQRYTRGCDVDRENPERMMPYSRLVKMATESGRGEIDENIVRQYFFQYHNGIVFALGRKENLSQEQIDHCLVHPAMIGKVDGGTLRVIYKPFFADGKIFRFFGMDTKAIQRDGLPDVERRDFISFHRGFAAEKLTHAEALELEQFNKNLIRSGLQ